MTLLDDLEAGRAKTLAELACGSSRLGKILQREGVPNTPELQRVLALARRVWETDEKTPRLVQLLSKELRAPGGTRTLYPHQAVLLADAYEKGGAVGCLKVGTGKCLGLGTPVLLHDGSMVPVEQVAVGDRLLGPDSLPRLVLSIARGESPLYRVVPIKGESWVCNDEHLLTLVHTVTGEVVDVPVKDYLRRHATWKKHMKLLRSSAVAFSARQDALQIDAYFMGLWYGDGTRDLRRVAISKPDAEVEACCRDIARAWGLQVRVDTWGACPTYRIVGERGDGNPLLSLMREIVGDAERIPQMYVRGSVEVRRAFLAGILDADGYLSNGTIEIVQNRIGVADDVTFIARSLGLRVVRTIKRVGENEYQRMSIAGNLASLPMRIPRKMAKPRRQKKDVRRTGFRLEALGEGPYAGFQIDGDGRFLLGDFTITHNTDLSYVAPTVLRAKRPVLLVPSKLRGKTERHFAELAKHWRAPPSFNTIGYQELSIAKNEKLLDKAQPDLIIADEAHKILNLDAAVTRRVERYLKGAPGTKLIIMSGTLDERALILYHHLLRWCLVDGMPLPGPSSEATVWSRAIDDVPISARMAPGALMALCTDEERAQVEQGADEHEIVREAYKRRLRETPGVVVTRDVDVAASLQIEVLDGVNLPRVVREAIDQAWAGKKPSGLAIEEGDEAMFVGELSLGFCYEPDQPAPLPWLERRRKYKQLERMILDQRRPGLDSPDQVKAALARGEFGRVEAFVKWRAIEDLYKPVMFPRWLTYEIIDEIAAIAKRLADDVVIWTDYWAPGDALRERHGFRFFRHDGADAKGPIEEASGIIVASIDGCCEGHNLQHRYATNLVLTPVGEPEAWEQFLGRTHRAGQLKDTVNVYALGHTTLYKGILGRLRANAKGTSRLAIADWV